MKSILVVTQDPDAFRVIHDCFDRGYRVRRTGRTESALEIVRRKHVDLIFIDLPLLGRGRENGYRSALEPFLGAQAHTEVVVMAPADRIREAVLAVKDGASNYLTHPVMADEVKCVADAIFDVIVMQSELDYLRRRHWQAEGLEMLRTRSPAMKKVYEELRSVAPTKSTVLLVGETGTGKGVLTRQIHRNSGRKDGPFISVHCGAIPDTLIESELFGHEKGSFTGAVRRKPGKFEIADKGTIFLDEIGTITPPAQIKLLQVLQEGSLQRVGGEEGIDVDVRVIAATNADLKEMCDRGEFRRDLYYRLNVFPIHVPALRERVEDIPSFIDVFLRKLNRFYAKAIDGVTPEVMEAFQGYPWPGNIRELENLVERAYILESGPMLTPDGFPAELFTDSEPSACLLTDTDAPLAEVRRRAVAEIERRYLMELLQKHRGRVNLSAGTAGITTRQLSKLLKKYGIRKEAFK